MKKKFIAAVLALAMLPMSLSVYAAGAWYEPYVQEVEQLGVKLKGDTVSNEQFLDAVFTINSIEPENVSIIQYAKDNGYITENEVPDPAADVSRQMVAKVISRVLQLPDGDEAIAESIADWEDTCPYCKPFILKCYGNGLMSGHEDGNFRGRYAASRYEIAAVLVNAYHYRKDKS